MNIKRWQKISSLHLLPNLFNHKNPRVYAEAIQQLYQSEPLIIIGLPFITYALCMGLWDSVSHTNLIIWACSMTFLSVVRYPIYRKFILRQKNQSLNIWVKRHLIQSTILGILWGVETIFIISQTDTEGIMFWTIGLMGNYMVAIPILAYWLPSFIAYVFFGPLAISISFYIYQVPKYEFLIIFVYIATSLVIITVFQLHHLIMTSIKNRFENSDLIIQLRQEKNHAEQSDRSKSHFLATASHDLRQPLHAMGLYIYALNQLVMQPEQKKIIEKLQQSEKSLKKLLNALLDISTLDSGNQSCQQQAISCQTLMQSLVTEFQPQFYDKKTKFRVKFSQYRVLSDPTLLTRMLRNLLHNALRYAEGYQVLFSARKRANSILFQVWDPGIGIPQDKQQQIFEDFVQLHNHARQQEQGLGLGLSIVQRLSQMLQHPISLKSVEGQGSVFSITVNITYQTIAPNQTTIPTSPTPQQVLNKTVFLIDDQLDALDAMVLLLESFGCQVISAYSMQHLFKQINTQQLIQPDAIVTDYRLSERYTGIDVIKRLRQHYQSTVPALIITGDTSPEKLKLFQDSRIPILYKPVPPHRLRLFLQRVKTPPNHP
jgi:signal transduction histidine kinase/CheY-like chemotaxis protein